jgi:hypothetical protein
MGLCVVVDYCLTMAQHRPATMNCVAKSRMLASPYIFVISPEPTA